MTLAQVICVCGGGESEREMFLLFNFPALITFHLLLFFFFFFNSFGVKEFAEMVSLLILVLILITKLQECIRTLTLGGRQMVADGAGTGTGTVTGTGTDGDGDTGGDRMDLELQIPVDNSISASVGASMSAGNGVHA